MKRGAPGQRRECLQARWFSLGFTVPAKSASNGLAKDKANDNWFVRVFASVNISRSFIT